MLLACTPLLCFCFATPCSRLCSALLCLAHAKLRLPRLMQLLALPLPFCSMRCNPALTMRANHESCFRVCQRSDIPERKPIRSPSIHLLQFNIHRCPKPLISRNTIAAQVPPRHNSARINLLIDCNCDQVQMRIDSVSRESRRVYYSASKQKVGRSQEKNTPDRHSRMASTYCRRRMHPRKSPKKHA